MSERLNVLDALSTIEQNLVLKDKAIALLKKFITFNGRCWEMIKSLENEQNSELAEMYLQDIDKFYSDAKEEWENKYEKDI